MEFKEFREFKEFKTLPLSVPLSFSNRTIVLNSLNSLQLLELLKK